MDRGIKKTLFCFVLLTADIILRVVANYWAGSVVNVLKLKGWMLEFIQSKNSQSFLRFLGGGSWGWGGCIVLAFLLGALILHKHIRPLSLAQMLVLSGSLLNFFEQAFFGSMTDYFELSNYASQTISFNLADLSILLGIVKALLH